MTTAFLAAAMLLASGPAPGPARSDPPPAPPRAAATKSAGELQRQREALRRLRDSDDPFE